MKILESPTARSWRRSGGGWKFYLLRPDGSAYVAGSVLPVARPCAFGDWEVVTAGGVVLRARGEAEAKEMTEKILCSRTKS